MASSSYEIGHQHCVKIGQQFILNTANEKVLGVFFDNKLNFKCHLNKLCKKPLKNSML